MKMIDRLRELDSANQLDSVLALPDHLRDALWRVESARLQPDEGAGVLWCGMGSSAIGGELAVAALGERCTLPVETIRGYELPPWATPEWTVVCASFSGETEETLACWEAAGALGARRIAVTTGGALADAARADGAAVIGLPGNLPAPRTSVGYMFAIAAEAAALLGAPRLHTEIDAAAAYVEGRREPLLARADELAARLTGTVVVTYGAGLMGPAAMRWKTEINENAKLPAFWAQLPEADHNEVCGWTEAEGNFSAVLLDDADLHPRVRERIALTAELVSSAAAEVETVSIEGETRSERLLTAIMLGDLVSLFLAAHRGVDPTPIEAIETLKDKLGLP